MLRAQALVRRSQTAKADTTHVDDFCVNKNTFEISLDGKKLELTATEFKLLSLLIERRGKILSRDLLLSDVWGYKAAMDTRRPRWKTVVFASFAYPLRPSR